jgi:hypothetical protein
LLTLKRLWEKVLGWFRMIWVILGSSMFAYCSRCLPPE